MEPRLLGPNLALVDGWKLTPLPVARLTGWGYQDRYGSKERSSIRRALAAPRDLVTLLVKTLSG